MHCMQNVKELTTKSIFQKQASKLRVKANQKNQGFWVVLDESDTNSGFIGCDVDDTLGGKWTVLVNNNFKEIAMNAILRQIHHKMSMKLKNAFNSIYIYFHRIMK